MGLAYVKGKMDPHTVLKKLKKGGKHAMIHWITYGPERDDQYQPNHPHLSLLHGHAYDPYINYYANDPYYDHHLYGNYNPLHGNNIYNPRLLNNINAHHHGHHHQYLHRPVLSQPRERWSSVHLHQHSSPVQSSSNSTSPPSRPVTEPLVFKQPAASSVGDGFTKKVFSIKEVIGNKFRSCLGCVKQDS